MECNGQPQASRFAHLPGRHITEYQDGSAYARLAQWHCLAHRCHAQHTRAVVQDRACYFQCSMPVSVSLETGKNAHQWPHQGLNLARIVSDGAKIDLNPGGRLRAHTHDLLQTWSLAHQWLPSLCMPGHY